MKCKNCMHYNVCDYSTITDKEISCKDFICKTNKEVNTSCKYCEDMDFFYRIVCYIPTEYGGAMDIPINHCPACGRKLAEEDITEPYTETSYAFCKNCKYGDNFCDKGGLWTFCRIHNYDKMKQNDTCNQWEEDNET